MTPLGPHTPDRRSARFRGSPYAHEIDLLERQYADHLRLCGLDPEDARLDAEREAEEARDRFEDYGPALRWRAA